MSRLLDEVALDLHDAYAMKDIKALTLRYDGDTVVVICKDTKLAVSLMQPCAGRIDDPEGADDPMTPEQFCYWLQGRAELMPDTPPSDAEWKMIGEHLAAVFHKVTPPLAPPIKIQDQLLRATPPNPSPAELQRMLDRGQTVTLPPSWQCAVTC